MFWVTVLSMIGAGTLVRWAWRWAGSHPNQIAAREVRRRQGLLARLLKKDE